MESLRDIPDAWDAECYVALVREVEEATLDVGGGGGGICTWQEDTTSIGRKYHNMVLGGKVRAAVRMVTNRGYMWCVPAL